VGNGSRLTPSMLENAIEQSLKSFGKPDQLIVPHEALTRAFGSRVIHYPQYEGTVWANIHSLSTKQHSLAKLHTILNKLNILKKIPKNDLDTIIYKAKDKLQEETYIYYEPMD